MSGSTKHTGWRPEVVTESVLVARVERLTVDGSAVGPGAYDVQRTLDYKKGNAGFASVKARRPEHFAVARTNQGLGPGAYNPSFRIE